MPTPASQLYRDVLRRRDDIGPLLAAMLRATGAPYVGLERYLTEAEFQRVLECSPAEFAQLPRRKQDALRKKSKLYVRV
jgi:hypothetical protein